MIVSTDELPRLAGTVSMVDGGFDPIHAGHIAYLRGAHELGLPVLCNLAPDSWIERKHPPILPQRERAEVVDAIRWVDFTHPSALATVEVLELLRPRYYVKGADWRDRLPAEELAACARAGIEVVYLDTVLNSSSALLERYRERLDRRRGRPED
jgi:D-beta-D-heptose 7-phosphate kinase/D-beta-D-heptose 1-phosphate adenosyltransferase